MGNERANSNPFTIRLLAAGLLAFIGFYLLSRNDYLLFHSTVELLGVAVAFSVFVIAWNARRFMSNDYLLFVGIGFLFVSIIGTLHTLSYRGMGVFQEFEPTNLGAQFWIAARYIQAVTLIIAPAFIIRRLNTNSAFLGFGIVTGLIVASVLVWQNFPTMFVVSEGLTPIKVFSEFIISGILLGAIWLLRRNRSHFTSNVITFLTVAMAANISSEMAFTLYSDAYGFFNAVGHFLLLVSVYFVYKALIESGLSRPFGLMFHDLKQSEKRFEQRARDLAEVNRRLATEISERQKAEKLLAQREAQLRLKLDTILSPEADLGEQDLAAILDLPAVQQMMDDLYAVTGVGFSIIDLKGTVLVGTGWQDICTDFHRQSPSSCANCIESDLALTRGVKKGDFKTYKCKNNMWDIVTPLYIADQHVANVFTGQFLFEDETPDRALFERQADEFGFDKEAYLAALDRVPRHRREKVARLMDFFTRFSTMVSDLGYGNLKLAQAVADQQQAAAALRQSEEKYRIVADFTHDWEYWVAPDGCFMYNSPSCEAITGYSKDEFEAKPSLITEMIHPDDRDRILKHITTNSKDPDTLETRYRIIRKDGAERWLGHVCQPVFDREDRHIGRRASNRDITATVEAEQEVSRSRRDLARAQEVAKIGNWFMDVRRDILDWSEESYRIFEVPSGQAMTYDVFLSAVHPDDRQFVNENWQSALRQEKPYDIEHRVIVNGKIKWVREKAELEFDNDGSLRGGFGIVHDITSRKNSEANQVLLTGILRLLNRTGASNLLIRDTLGLIQKETGFDAVGLRLRRGNDCPYFEVNGFSEEFLEEENFLCAKGSDGRIIRDEHGEPVLECTCGLVITGKTDPTMPCFTNNGSFWTNLSTDLLSLAPQDDPRTYPRNRCIHAGYQSVGLFPVRAGKNIIGLLQLNDRRPDRFTPEQVSFYEGVAQNIGLALQRITSEEAVQRSAEEWQSTFDSITDIIMLLDPDHHIIRANKAFTDTFGITAEEAVGKQCFEIVHGTAHPPVFCPHVRTMKCAGEAKEEFLEPKLGIYIEATTLPIIAKDNSCIGSVHIVKNIHERKLAEVEREKLLRQIEDQKRLLESTLGQLPSGVVVRDTDGKLVMSNPEMDEIFGYLPQNIADFNASCCFHKNGLPYTTAEWPMLRTVNKGETVYNEEIEVVRPGGDRVTVLAATAPVRNEQGKVIANVGIFRDITDRREFEKEIENLSRFPAENPNPVLRVNSNCVLLYANPASNLLRNCWQTSVGEPLPEHLCNTVAEAIASDQDQIIEITCGERIFSFVFAPIKDFGYVNLYGRDITERKRAEQALQTLNAELENRVRERTQELATAHTKLLEQLEFRVQAEDSLRSLSTRLLRIQEEERRAIARELHDQTGQSLTVLKLMVGRADRMAHEELKPLLKDAGGMITDIIKQIRSLSLSLRPGVLDDLGLVPAMDWLFKQLRTQADLNIHFDHDGLTGLSQDINTAIYRITQEALTNVMRHAGVKEAWISLRRDEEQISLRIEDHGRGFDTTAASQSTGLSAMRERASLLGGNCVIESNPGQGTNISIYLPLTGQNK